MLKKLMIVSSIVLLVCLMAGAVLTPMAVADTISMADKTSDKYSAVNEQLSISSDGITEVSLENGRIVEKLVVKPSPDGKIHVYTDGFHEPDTQFTYVVNEEQQFLTLSNYWRGDYNPWKSLTRENILKQIVREFSRRSPYVELQLPDGVAYDLDSPTVWEAEIDPQVESIHSGRYSDPWEHDDAADEYDEGDEMPLESIDPASGLTAEQMLEISRTVMAQNDQMLQAYRAYGENSDQTIFWETANLNISTTAPLLARLSGRTDEWEQEELAQVLIEYMTAVAEKSLLEIAQDNLELEYRQGRWDKETYYAMDLDYDREQENWEMRIDDLDSIYDLDEQFDRFETVLGFELVLAEDRDLSDLADIQ